MEERILTIKIEERRHIKPVLEKIERIYPEWKWICGSTTPTNFIPDSAKYIFLYKDTSITYSLSSELDADGDIDKIILSGKFISENSINNLDMILDKRVVINCSKEIKRLKKKKNELIDKFVDEVEQINSQIKYLKELSKRDNRFIEELISLPYKNVKRERKSCKELEDNGNTEYFCK